MEFNVTELQVIHEALDNAQEAYWASLKQLDGTEDKADIDGVKAELAIIEPLMKRFESAITTALQEERASWDYDPDNKET